MSISIDQLEISIQSSAVDAKTSLKELQKALAQLTNSLTRVGKDGSTRVDKLATSFGKLNAAIGQLTTGNVRRVQKLANAMETLATSSKQLQGFGNLSKQFKSAEKAMRMDVRPATEMENPIEEASKYSRVLEKLGKATEGFKTKIASVKESFHKFMDKAIPQSITRALKLIRKVAILRLIRSALSKLTRSFSEGLKNAYAFSKLVGGPLAKALDDCASATLTMKNQLGAALGSLLTNAMPIIKRLIDFVTQLANGLTQLFAALGGSTTYLKANSDLSAVWDENANSVKQYKRELLGLDELNVLSTPTSNNGGVDVKDMFTETPVDSFFLGVKKWTDDALAKIKQSLSDIEELIPAFLTGIGLILTLSGANVPLGLGMLAVGTYLGVRQLAENWGWSGTKLQKTLGTIESVLGASLLGVGAVLAFSGGHIPLGIGLMVAGATSLGSGIMSLSWSKLSKKTQKVVSTIASILGGSLLVLGGVLAFSGASLPIGIGMMIAGASALATTAALNWNTLTKKVSGVVSGLAKVIGGAMLGVGAVLTFSGANLPLGIGLMAAGAIGLASQANIDWSSVVGKVGENISKITMALSSANLVLGAVLTFTGANLPLGLSMIAAGVAGFVTVGKFDWDSLLNRMKEEWNSIKNWFNQSVAKFLTKEYWEEKFKSIPDGFLAAFGALGDILKGILVGTGLMPDSDPVKDLGYQLALEQIDKNKTGWTDWMHQPGSGSKPTITKPSGQKVYLQANGGYVPGGHLFYANENGNPEYIGNMGGTTAVANSDQMSAAIESAAYRGMAKALAQNGGSQATFVIEGDPQGMFRVVQKQARSYLNRTGLHAFE